MNKTYGIFFDKMAKNWNENIPIINYEIALSIIERFKIGTECSVLDVACGTGILYSILKDRNLSQYVGIDISKKMIEVFSNNYQNADVRLVDFESNVLLEKPFDFIIIFNSIPHFKDLDAVFRNACINLKNGGTFIISHSKTREALKEYHKKIGYVADKKEPIPSDVRLLDCCERYGFSNLNVLDTNYFCFSTIRK